MAKRMLIDAAHPEETRVVVLNGHRLEEFDFESSTKKQVKGNIYLAKVTRVEPSLQAAFVDYGGNRHGFLAFSEIHPDYYRIPVGDRGAAHDESSAITTPLPLGNGGEDAAEETPDALATALPEPVAVPPSDEHESDESGATPAMAVGLDFAFNGDAAAQDGRAAEPGEDAAVAQTPGDEFGPAPATEAPLGFEAESIGAPSAGGGEPLEQSPEQSRSDEMWATGAAAAISRDDTALDRSSESEDGEPQEGDSVETLGGDEIEEADAERQRSRAMRHYKIQEVVKRRQIMLVQVTKEERGNKGAALTTYLSLAGRYCVLMPNTGRGGGVSRKITSISDRRRLKDILSDLEIPDGMGVIVRTAGSERSKAEIKRDYEYLLRLWNEIRDLTLQSTAPALIYEEGNLIKRSIRDLYTRDIDEVLVEGEDGYRTAKGFMRMLMPSHARRVQPYRDAQVGLFHRFQVESQIDAIHSPVAQLRSGGYVVINQTEALVAIDVNSGRATRERNIEETALRTNLEAADEIARQLRLRDLAGLIVIDFIDMEEHRNQIAVERRLKEALKNDRARIQVGRISPFGLLEMSRQRLRPSLVETSTQPCPHCGGAGFVRSTESTALHVLRSIEEEGIRRRSAEICIYVPTTVALYVLNQKRDSLAQIEARYRLSVTVARDDSLIPPAFRLERLRAYEAGEMAPPVLTPMPSAETEDEDEDGVALAEAAEAAGADEAAEREHNGRDERGRRRRRRPRRRREEEREAPTVAAIETAAHPAPPEVEAIHEEAGASAESEAERRRRRRGRRGGRRRPRREDAAATGETGHAAAQTIEIVAEPESDDSSGAASALPAEPARWLGNGGLETASLPAVAGEIEERPATAVADEPAEAGAVHPAAAESAPAPTAEAVAGIPYTSAMERRLEEAVTEEAAQPHSEPAPANEPADEAAAQPALSVQAVTAKPANPRRGWWQRLINP